MGMDLIPRNKKIDGIHFNWTGWRIFGNILESLDCDLSEMDGANDGAKITAKTSREWAKAIRNAIRDDKINTTVFIQDASYAGGAYKSFRVVEKDSVLAFEDKEWLLKICYFLDHSSGSRQF